MFNNNANTNNKFIDEQRQKWLQEDGKYAALKDSFKSAGEDINKLYEQELQVKKKQEFDALDQQEINRLNLAEELTGIQKERHKREFKKLSNLEKFQSGLSGAFGEGKSDHVKAFWNARESQDLDIEAPRIQQIVGVNPTWTRLADALGVSNPADRESRKSAGLGLSENGWARAGQVLGTLGSDINQDRSRSLWWLLNAPQAVANVSQEALISHTAPDLYSSDKVTNDDGFEIVLDKKNYAELMNRDLISLDREGNPVLKQGVNRVSASDAGNKGKIALSKRRYRPGMVDALGIPSGLAINAGVGLLNPLGGSNGYTAVFESEDDPTKTDNVVGEVAAKYILGRTGKLLNWDEFKQVRPDVSKDEYMRYKAFKYDKEADLNPFDGDFTLPVGIAKGTMEGIHGPEIQFLGRSMPLLTTLMPVVAAGVGTSAGAAWQPKKFDSWSSEKNQMKKMREDRINKIKKTYNNPEVIDDKIRQVNVEMKDVKRKVWADKPKADRDEYLRINRVRNGLGAGMGAYAVSLGAGLLLEGERRRRNQAENESNQTQL